MATCCDPAVKPQAVALKVALVGNPNGGKTTLFNALTGRCQKVGNWPGVTVACKRGYYARQGRTVEVIDLPGVYALIAPDEAGAVDERIACDFVWQQQADVIVNVVDANHLARHLYLTQQLLEMGVPVVVALNMMDVAETNGTRIDVATLAQALGCPVVPLAAVHATGVARLKEVLADYVSATPMSADSDACLAIYPPVVQQAVHALCAQMTAQSLQDNVKSPQLIRALALRLLEDDVGAARQVATDTLTEVNRHKTLITAQLGEDADIILADARYKHIDALLARCVSVAAVRRSTWTARIDSIVLNRVLGMPIFLAVMYLLFVFAINVGGAFQDFFDLSTQTIFVDGLAYALSHCGAPAWLTALLANGLGKGINTTVTFIPVIGAMFLFLAFLEDSGYMARAAFVVDRLMRALGLPGKAFVPMIVGFGCNVPAIMATRTLENKRDRILTVMMSPFMSCGARLAIFAAFTSIFFAKGAQNVVFALYLIGILMAMATGFILQKTVLRGAPSPLVMELPPYHVPRLSTIGRHAWQRLQRFIFRAGKLIVPICMVIGALNSLSVNGTLCMGDGDQHSILCLIGRWFTPLFQPMGITADNWPATVGLVTGVLAKEVVIGTLNTLYAQVGHLNVLTAGDGFHLWAGLRAALVSIPENLYGLRHVFSNPVLAQAPLQALDRGVNHVLYTHFAGRAGAFAYLLFVLLYVPCVSTIAATARELNRAWAVFSVVWMTGVAYGAAVVFYQLATWAAHPWSSTWWVVGVMTVLMGTLFSMRWVGNQQVAPAPVGGAHELNRA